MTSDFPNLAYRVSFKTSRTREDHSHEAACGCPITWLVLLSHGCTFPAEMAEISGTCISDNIPESHSTSVILTPLSSLLPTRPHMSSYIIAASNSLRSIINVIYDLIMATNAPAGHPPIDWTKWEPAGEGDGLLTPKTYISRLISLTSRSPLTLPYD